MFCFYAVLKEWCGYKEVVKCDRDPLSCLVPLSALSVLSRAMTYELMNYNLMEILSKLMNEINSDWRNYCAQIDIWITSLRH